MGITDELTRRVHIKMSGCPNGCSQHHIANIGFYGASIKVGDKRSRPTSPTSAATTRAARSSTATGSRRACPPSGSPTRSSAGCATTRQKRNDGEEFNDFVERVGTDEFEELVSDLKLPVEFNADNLVHFIDWNRSEPYKVERGEGECAV